MSNSNLTDPRFQPILKEGGQPSVSPEIGKVDPTSVRSKLMLECFSHMMTEVNWPYRRLTINTRSQGDEIGQFSILGANDPASIREVHERKTDIAILNPSTILHMGHRGVGLFDEKMEVALIAVIPHLDQVGFGVTKASGLTSLDDIREKKYPLRLSVRGCMDACTTLLVEKVLNVHGFGYEDILSWGGSISYDQPMPNEPTPGQPSRVQRVESGELDAIFEEGVVVWANRGKEIGMNFLDISDERLTQLEAQGFTRSKMLTTRYEKLESDVNTIDFSGWPIYCRVDTSDLLIRKFCEAMDARKGVIPWTFGPIEQSPMPLAQMLVEGPGVPKFEIPFHPIAKEYWIEHGYMK